MSVVLGVILVLAVAGALMGVRHLYLRLDRPGGMSCSLRVVHGELSGLGRRFLAGYAGPQMHDLLWRRVAWPGPRIVFPLSAIRIDRERRPLPRERWQVPASFTVVPVELPDGVVLELALPRRGLGKLVALVGGGPAGPGR